MAVKTDVVDNWEALSTFTLENPSEITEEPLSVVSPPESVIDLPQLGALQVAAEAYAAAELTLASAVMDIRPMPIVFGAEAFYQPRTGLDHSNGSTIILEGGPVLLRRLVYGYPKRVDSSEVKTIADLFVVDLESTDTQYWLTVEFGLVDVYAEVDIPRGASRKLTKRPTAWTHVVKLSDLGDIEIN